MSGRWITGELGAKKIEACASVFFPLCLDRLSSVLPGNFVPWMASPKLSKDFYGKIDFPEWKVGAKIEFDQKNLEAQQFFLDLAIKDSEINITTRMRVFENIIKQEQAIAIYQSALELTHAWPRWQRNLFENIVKSIVPVWVPQKGRQDGNSFTDPDFLGAIFTSIDPRSPFPDITLNITFAHELGHLCLMFYQFSGDLFFGNKKEVYSGVRKTTRPIVAAFHAAVALTYMITAARSLLANVAKEDVYKSAYLNALLSDYSSNLEVSLKEIDQIEKSPLCADLMRDLWESIR